MAHYVPFPLFVLVQTSHYYVEGLDKLTMENLYPYFLNIPIRLLVCI